MSAVAVAVSVGAGIAGGVASSRSANRAQKANQRATTDANRMNLLLNLVSRGAPMEGIDFPESVQGQSSALLPIYFGDTEKNLATNAQKIFEALSEYYGLPADQIKENLAAASGFEPGSKANDQLVVDLATGKVTREMVDESQPVFQARTGMAESKRNAGLEALRETLSEIDAIQAGRGFSGDTTGNRMLKFNARRAIGSQSAQDFSEARLTNAQELRDILTGGRNMRLANLDLPDQRAAAAINRRNLPAIGVNQAQQLQNQPFKFFDIGPGSPSRFEPLTFQPKVSTAEIISRAVNKGASAYGNKMSTDELIAALTKNNGFDYGSGQTGGTD